MARDVSIRSTPIVQNGGNRGNQTESPGVRSKGINSLAGDINRNMRHTRSNYRVPMKSFKDTGFIPKLKV